MQVIYHRITDLQMFFYLFLRLRLQVIVTNNKYKDIAWQAYKAYDSSFRKSLSINELRGGASAARVTP